MATLTERLAEQDVADLADWQAAEILTAPDAALPTRRVDVQTHDVRGALLASGEWPAIVMAAEAGSGALAEVRGLCILVRDTLMLTTIIETSNPARYAATAAALAGLVAAGLVTQATADALLAMADQPQSWAQANGVTVDARAVGLARGALA